MGISEKKTQIVINNYFKQECDVNTSIREAFEKGFRIGIKKVSSAKPDWIPCSVRLPEKDGRYLITEKTDGVKVQEGYFCRTRDGEPYWGYLHVIAWRPLPEPYTEEES